MSCFRKQIDAANGSTVLGYAKILASISSSGSDQSKKEYRKYRLFDMHARQAAEAERQATKVNR